MKMNKLRATICALVAGAFSSLFAVDLPEGYTPVDWIESSGTQWVNLDIVPNATDRVEMEFLFPSSKAKSTGWHTLFCARDTSNKTTFTTFWGGTENGGQMRVDRNATTGSASGPVSTDNVRYALSLNYGTCTGTLTANGSATTAPTFPADTGSYTVGGKLALFASHSAGTGLSASSAMTNLGRFRLYSFRLLDSAGTARADLVPCVNASGLAGLYDTVRNLFYGNSGSGAFATSTAPYYAKRVNDGYVFYNQALTEVPAPEGGLNETITLLFANTAEYQALVAVPEDVARAKGVALQNDIILTAATDWSALEFDMNEHIISLKGCNLKVASLLGKGTVTSCGSLIANGGFSADAIPSGSTRTGSLTPRGWKGSAGLVLKNDTSYCGHQRNNAIWFRIPQGGNISQTFTIATGGSYRLSYNTCASNPSSGTTSWASCDARIDGVSVTKQLKMGWEGSNGKSISVNVNIGAGTHTFALYSTKEGGASYGTPIVKNVALYPNSDYVNATSVLEIAVPEGVATTNSNVVLAGGASLRVWKTGKGSLTMAKVNGGFGISNAIAGWESIIVKEGTLYKTSNGATLGVQYARVAVNDGSQVDIGGRSYWDYDYELAGAGPDGLGALVNTTSVSEPWTSSSVGYLRNLVLVGDTTIGGTKSWGMMFYNYGSNTATMNGHTLTYSGATIYGGLLSYSGTGRIVIDEGTTVEFYSQQPSAGDCVLEVRGTLQQHDKALTPVKSLIFTGTGSFNNTWTTRPGFVVRNTYAPNLRAGSSSAVPHPTVQLGDANYLETTLDLSLLTETFNGSSTTFYNGSFVTVQLGAREVVSGEKLVSWSMVPSVEFQLSGDNIAAYQLYVGTDGLYVRGMPSYATIDPATGVWSYFGANGQPYPGEWTGGITTDIDVHFSSLEEYEAIRTAAVTPKRYRMTGLVLTGPTDLTGGFPFSGTPHAVIDLRGQSLKLPPATLTSSFDLTITDTLGGYDYLKSIQSSGTQYIDTGFVCSTATRLDAKFNTLTRSQAWGVFYGVTSNDSSADGVLMRYYNATDQLSAWFCAGANVDAATGMANKDVEVVLAKDTLNINGVSTPFTTTGTPYKSNLFLFCGNSGGSAWRHQAMRLYSFKITEAGTVVRDFVPVCRHRDGAVGLLDRVNNVFYANKGSGTFAAGEVTSSTTRGELHVEVVDGETVTFGSGSATITGELVFVKEGAGTLVTSRSQTYVGGTDVRGGTLKWGDAYPGPYGSFVTVFEGAFFDLGGRDNASSRPVLAGGTLINTVKDIGNGLAQNAVISVVSNSTMNLAFTTGLIGSSYTVTTLDLCGNELDIALASGKSFWLYNADVTAGTLKFTGAGTLQIDKTSVRAAAADFDLGCNVSAAVATEVHDWIVREGVTVSGAGQITINGTYKAIGDSISSYKLKDGATLDLSGRNEALDVTNKVSFADNATITVKPQPGLSGLIVPWIEPTNLETLTFVKAEGETGKLSVTPKGLVYIRSLTIFFR